MNHVSIINAIVVHIESWLWNRWYFENVSLRQSFVSLFSLFFSATINSSGGIYVYKYQRIIVDIITLVETFSYTKNNYAQSFVISYTSLYLLSS